MRRKKYRIPGMVSDPAVDEPSEVSPRVIPNIIFGHPSYWSTIKEED
jgi:hypothetical protein